MLQDLAAHWKAPESGKTDRCKLCNGKVSLLGHPTLQEITYSYSLPTLFQLVQEDFATAVKN